MLLNLPGVQTRWTINMMQTIVSRRIQMRVKSRLIKINPFMPAVPQNSIDLGRGGGGGEGGGGGGGGWEGGGGGNFLYMA